MADNVIQMPAVDVLGYAVWDGPEEVVQDGAFAELVADTPEDLRERLRARGANPNACEIRPVDCEDLLNDFADTVGLFRLAPLAFERWKRTAGADAIPYTAQPCADGWHQVEIEIAEDEDDEDEDDEDEEYSDEGAAAVQETVCAWIADFEQSAGFAALEEAYKPEAAFIVEHFADFAYSYEGEQPAQWSAATVDEVCLFIFPRKVSTDEPFFKATAPVLAAFFRFLEEQGHHPNGKALARAVEPLGPRIVENAHDPAHWGMAKSFLMGAEEEGIDPGDEEALNAYIERTNRRLEAGHADAGADPVGPEYVTFPKKPSKNAPCPCGSGRKYKGCCGRAKR